MDEAILIIEDDMATAQLVRDALDARGYTVRHAAGAAGLALAQVLQPAVVLLDLHMPGMDGVEVSRQLRADARTARIPIVGMSSDDAHKAGMLCDDSLTKPFALADLYTVVARWLHPTPTNRIVT